ncbi:MAG: dynamin family protein [Anaerolineaceae bacterium]|nr:dynamin family protein [Anaerolineaceae bacterium]
MRQSMLTEEQNQLLMDEKEALSSILLRLSKIEIAKDKLPILQKAALQLDELFLIVVVGEFNAGKSALINAMLGEMVLSEGVIPTTTRVTLIKWGESKNEKVVDDAFAVVSYPLPLLKELNFVDSPGTNAIIRQHERLTDEYVPRSDLVLFTTSADRPMTESERQFLQRILGWGKKVVFVLNKADILETESSLQQAQDFIIKNATVALGEAPVLFPVSARMAQRAFLASDETERQRLRDTSRLDELETFISTTLDDTERLRLKMISPLGVAKNLIDQLDEQINAQSDELKEDARTSDALENTITAYERDLESELAPRLAEVENILHKFEMRGLDFFDRVLRLTNVHNLVRGDKIRAAFEVEVLGDVSELIDRQVQQVIDWLVEKDLREWQQVMTYLQRRQSLNLSQIVGGAGNSQEIHRRELIEKVGQKITTIIESYDHVKEASHLAASVETAVAQTALFEVGAVGLGALVSTALLSSALDITGMVAAGTLAIVGFFVIPHKRKQAKENFREKIVAMRINLNEALTGAFIAESKNAIARLQESISPYTRYVHAEQEKIQTTQTQLNEIRQIISEIRARVETTVKE